MDQANYCFSYLKANNEIVIVKRGEHGFHRTGLYCDTIESARLKVVLLNNEIGVLEQDYIEITDGVNWGEKCE